VKPEEQAHNEIRIGVIQGSKRAEAATDEFWILAGGGMGMGRLVLKQIQMSASSGQTLQPAVTTMRARRL
jgi:hypothetical protein